MHCNCVYEVSADWIVSAGVCVALAQRMRCVARGREHTCEFSSRWYSRTLVPRIPAPAPPTQFHFPWKLTGEISFDDIAAAGGPPDQWDALPTNAKLQIILFIGPRILQHTDISTATLVARKSCLNSARYLLQSKMMTKRSGS